MTVEGYRLFFFSNEGAEPPHIHVQKGEASAKFWLKPIELSEATSLKPAQMRRLRHMVEEHEDERIKAWTKYFD